MKSIIIITVVLFCTLTTQAQTRDSFPSHENRDSVILEMAKIKAATSEEMKKADIQYFVIRAAQNTFGYAIYIDGNMAIEQSTIPSLPGTLGFKDIATTEKIAKLVIQKIREGEMPPTLGEEEVRALVGQ